MYADMAVEMYFIAAPIQLLDTDDEIHLIGFFGRNPQLQLHVSGQLGVLAKGQVEFRSAVCRVVGDSSLAPDLIEIQSIVPWIEIQLLVLGPGNRPLVLVADHVVIFRLLHLQPDRSVVIIPL